jgi:hypothetical protein
MDIHHAKKVDNFLTVFRLDFGVHGLWRLDILLVVIALLKFFKPEN